MKSTLKIPSGITILLAVVVAVLQFGGDSLPPVDSSGRAVRGQGIAAPVQYTGADLQVVVGEPSAPTISPAVRDLPPYKPDLPLLNREMKPRDDHGFVGPDIQMPPHGNPLAELQQNAQPTVPDDFGTPVLNFAGVQSSSSPPDDTGDVGPNHYVQADNGPGGSRVTIYDKLGTQLAQFNLESLASTAPCNVGYCDPIVQYDEMADRWLLTEFDSSATTLCVYVSTTPDPLGTYYAYSFDPAGGMQDYPKYGVWPDGYYIGVNNNGYVHALDRVKMLAGQPATYQSFNIGTLPGFGFQLTLPATAEGIAPPAGAPAIFMQPVDTEVHSGYTCSPEPCDLMDVWALHVDWAVPGNSSLTALPDVEIAEFDHTLCGTGSDWSCMRQPNTPQRLDPIREPIHFPLQYRNWGSYETLVGCFAEDVDGTDRAGVHWFEMRRDAGDWYMYQEGVLSENPSIDRSVCSAAMDSSGNIAVGYTRTGANVPYYPSIYYSGRLASDPLGTMPYYDNLIWDATTSNTDNERWGDYSGIGVDPFDGCTFWYTTEYGGSGQTRIAAFKFDACGSTDFALAATPENVDICVPDDAVYDVSVTAISGFAGDVTLSAVGNPGSASFVPNPVTPTGNSTLTISGAGVGTYAFDVYGTSVLTPSLVHSDTVNLNVSDAPPPAPTLLTPTNGAVDVSVNPTYTWSDVGAASYDIEIATDPGFTNIVDSATGLTEPTYDGAPLAPSTLYYWRVRPNNACGAGAYSTAFHFTTESLPCILLVDDDNNSPDVLPYFTAALDNLGYDYHVASGEHPTSGEMAGYEVVIWFSGDKYGGSAGPDDTDETNLAAYLDSGGKLFLSSQDYLYDFGLTPFGQNYLGIQSFTSDTGNATTKYGVPGDPIGDGLGPYALSYPSSFTDYGDIVNAGNGGSVAFRASAGGGNNLDVDKDGGAWQTVFFGTSWVPIYNSNAANGQEALDSIIQWFGGCACDPVHDADFGWDPLTPVVGQEIMFYGSAAGDSPILFDWSLGDGSTASGQVHGHTYSLEGDYTVVMTATNCADSIDTAIYTVTVAPCVSPTLSLLESDSPVEFGQAAHFTASLSAGTPPLDYVWDFGGDGVGDGADTATPVFTYTLPGAYTATVTVSNFCGSAEGSTAVDVVCDGPEATFSHDSPVDLGQPIHFAADVTGTGDISYTWDFGDGIGASAEASPVYTYTTGGDFVVTLTVEDWCGSQTVTDTVTINPLWHYWYLPLIQKQS